MRISDWSSDVCSSDLGWDERRFGRSSRAGAGSLRVELPEPPVRLQGLQPAADRLPRYGDGAPGRWGPLPCWPVRGRSEENTSELQSLMRSSYAVFCLKKKTQLIDNNAITRQPVTNSKTNDKQETRYIKKDHSISHVKNTSAND